MAEKLQEYSLTWEVTDEMTAKRIGSAGSQILSTPNMVALMENLLHLLDICHKGLVCQIKNQRQF